MDGCPVGRVLARRFEEIVREGSGAEVVGRIGFDLDFGVVSRESRGC